MSEARRWAAGVPTVDVDGVAVAFVAPAPDLAELVIDYGFYDSGPAGSRRRMNHYLPGAANVCITFDAGPVEARIRNHHARWTDDAMLFGPSSHLMSVESNGGRLIGFGLTPLGWARLFGKHARTVTNRVVPLAVLIGAGAASALYSGLAQARSVPQAARVVDDAIRALARHTPREAAMIAALAGALRDPAVADCTDVANALGASEAQVRRVAQHYFGFGPKLLLRRQRFVAAAAAVIEHGSATHIGGASGDYYDQSHFIRDAQRFLGMTARQFARDITPLMDAMRRGRRAAFGHPLQSLITPGEDNLAPAAARLDEASPAP